MSPEQMRSGRLADERSDIWSLGVILYELLSGHVPFSADNLADLAVKIATETPTPLSEERAEVPAELSQAIARCLDKERSQRFPNVAELARALAPFGPSRALAHAERAERILQATHASTPRARITPMTISTAITALGSHSRLRGVGPERGVLAFDKLPKRALWIGGAVLVGAAAIGALSWGMSTREPSVVHPSTVQLKAEETRTQAAQAAQAAQADEQVPSTAAAEAPLERPAQAAVLDPLPTGVGAPVKQASPPVEPTTVPAAKAQGATPAEEKPAAVSKAQATAPAAEKASAPKAKTAASEPPQEAQAATPTTKADAAAKPRPPAAAAVSVPPEAAEPKPETEPKPVAPPPAAPKAKDSELDSLGGRL
jgi:serine/threonine-protein kinase